MPWSGITHQHLLGLMIRLPTDFEPYGERSRETDFGPDCSCGCKWFLKAEGKLGYDWGVCANPEGPRRGLLTFEHQGCKHYDEDPELGARVEQMRAANPNRFTREQLVARWKEWFPGRPVPGEIDPDGVRPGSE